MKLFLVVLALVCAVSFGHSASRCARQRISERRKLLKLHQKAARCGDEDSACITRVFNKIAGVRRRMASLKKCASTPVRISTRNCHTTFEKYLDARRAKIHRLAKKCGIEDDSCIQTSMDLLVALSKDQERQRRLWAQSCLVGRNRRHTRVTSDEVRREKRRIKKNSKVLEEENWLPVSTFSHEFVCQNIRRGFKRWLKSQEKRRESFHKDAGKCRESDIACLHMNFQSIIHVQRAIHRARKLYADRMATCDECARVKIVWQRWMERQRRRRHRLQLEACRCPEQDAGCMQRKVDKIKEIQKRMAQRRSEAFRLHGECHRNELAKHQQTSMAQKETPIPDL